MVRNNNSNRNMLSPQVLVQVEDLLMAPTPPSVSSSTASAPPQLPYQNHRNPASPVKPLAEKRAVTVTVSTVSKGPRHEEGDNNYSITTVTTTTANKTTTLINLNEDPSNLDDGLCGTPSPQRAGPTTSMMPRLLPPTVEREMNPQEVVGAGTTEARAMAGYNQQQRRGCSSSSSSSCLSKGEGSWLALSTPNPAHSGSNRG
ncbi:unnamed protein product [Ilex paraguariensis]|uniref:Uncharacterized protein n=1 Tax=Ilex paraguariensis TaxID=185542 RepID=A0ABC8R562_9AQUA